jgi:integrase
MLWEIVLDVSQGPVGFWVCLFKGHHRIQGDDGEPIETMELVVERIDQSHRLMFELLAATGLRRSELFVLEGHHLALDGERPHVKVRQRVRRRRGEGLVIGPLHARHLRSPAR